jgi:hypothetical protein
VSISANPSGAICSGTSVTFTAVPTNGGTAPKYQWKKNGTNITGATSVTYKSSALVNTNIITCVMTSNLSGVTGSPATSNSITMIVNTNVTASVKIAASPSGTIKSGTSVKFTATAINGGTAPTYQWKKNGTAISGATSSTYTTSTLANGNIITCVMTSNAPCETGSPATSNSITMKVTASSSANTIVEETTGISETEGTEFNVYPNPSSGVLHVIFDSKDYPDAKITLSNTIGQSLIEKNLDNHIPIVLDISNLPQGMYFVKFETDKIVYLKKVLIIR